MLAEASPWVMFAETIRRSTRTDPVVSGAETLLHYCLQFHPPLDLVRLLNEALPEAVYLSDPSGRYPIHIAAQCGSSPSVIRFLLQRNSHAAGIQDLTGKTPLHLVCEHYMKAYDPVLEPGSYQPPSQEGAMINVVTDLCSTAPDAVNVEDHEFRSAVEISIEFDCPLNVIKQLQKLSVKDWRARKNSVDSHERAQKDIHTHIEKQKRKIELKLKCLSRPDGPLDQDLSIACRRPPSGPARGKPVRAFAA